MMIDEILRLLPETRTILVVVGASQVEQFWLKEMKREFGRFAGRLQFIWTNELSFDEIVERCRTMPAQSAIFFAILALDGKGEPRIEGDTLASLHAVANAPMFALYGIGRGIVGGPLLSTDELSRTTDAGRASCARRRIAGRASRHRRSTPASRPTTRASCGAGISTSAGCRRPASCCFASRRSGSAISARSLSAALLGRDTGRRDRPARRPRQTTSRPEPRTDCEGRSPPGRADAHGQGMDRWRRWPARGSWPGSCAPRRTNRGWLRCIPMTSSDAARSTVVRSRRREPFQMEYRVREAGGAERWILDTGLPRFSGKDFDGYVGSAVDITRLGRAHAELSNLSRHLMQAHERERAALAKTLHEDVCQRMVALTLRLHNLQGTAHDGEVARYQRETGKPGRRDRRGVGPGPSAARAAGSAGRRPAILRGLIGAVRRGDPLSE